MYYASFQYHWTQLTSTSLEFISTGWQLVCRWLAVPCVLSQPTVARFMFVLDDVWSIHPAVSRCTFRAAGSLYQPKKKKEGRPEEFGCRLKIRITDMPPRVVDNRRNIPSLFEHDTVITEDYVEPRNGDCTYSTHEHMIIITLNSCSLAADAFPDMFINKRRCRGLLFARSRYARAA